MTEALFFLSVSCWALDCNHVLYFLFKYNFFQIKVIKYILKNCSLNKAWIDNAIMHLCDWQTKSVKATDKPVEHQSRWNKMKQTSREKVQLNNMLKI